MTILNHLEKLRYFCTVVETGSILQASKDLRLAQPHLSRVIKTLEDETGELLLIRSRHGVLPTPAGHELYNFSKSIAGQTEFFEQKLKRLRPLALKIKLGTYDSIARYFFPAFLRYARTAHPDLSLNIESKTSAEIIQKVLLKELNLGVVVESQKVPELIFTPVYEDHFATYSSPSLDLSARSCLIYFRGWTVSETRLRKEMLNKFENTISVDNLETVRTLTEEGVGIGIMPTQVARQGLLKGSIVPSKRQLAPSLVTPHKIGIVVKKNDKELPEQQEFIQELHRFLRRWSQN